MTAPEEFAQMTTEEIVRGLMLRWHERANALSAHAQRGGDPEQVIATTTLAFAYRAAATGLLFIGHTLEREDVAPELPSKGLYPHGRPGLHRSSR